MTDDWIKRVKDPDGREVVFDVGSHLHLAERGRGYLLDNLEIVLGAIERPDHRDNDPAVAGRERFYREDFPFLGQWLRVVVDFNDQPAWVVTALPQNDDPRLQTP